MQLLHWRQRRMCCHRSLWRRLHWKLLRSSLQCVQLCILPYQYTTSTDVGLPLAGSCLSSLWSLFKVWTGAHRLPKSRRCRRSVLYDRTKMHRRLHPRDTRTNKHFADDRTSLHLRSRKIRSQFRNRLCTNWRHEPTPYFHTPLGIGCRWWNQLPINRHIRIYDSRFRCKSGKGKGRKTADYRSDYRPDSYNIFGFHPRFHRN